MKDLRSYTLLHAPTVVSALELALTRLETLYQDALAERIAKTPAESITIHLSWPFIRLRPRTPEEIKEIAARTSLEGDHDFNVISMRHSYLGGQLRSMLALAQAACPNEIAVTAEDFRLFSASYEEIAP